MAIVTIDQVDKLFPNGFQALKNVSVDFEPGSFTAILGPSGAGKSTLLRMMNGLELPTGGQVHVDGIHVAESNLRNLRGSVGMIFQHFNLVERLSVMTNVLTGRLRNCSSWQSLFFLFHKMDREVACEALERVGLLEKAWERADRLSGGQQQRVGIARALAQKPRLLLADEPVASLDPVTSVEIMQLLRDICDRDGVTVIVNLHQVDLARRFADRIVGLNAGELSFAGAVGCFDDAALEKVYRKKGA